MISDIPRTDYESSSLFALVVIRLMNRTGIYTQRLSGNKYRIEERIFVRSEINTEAQDN